MLGTVLECSRRLCLSLYRKQQCHERSYLAAAELWAVALPPSNMAALAALYGWRDAVARQLDESTGYVLPKAQLIELARALPGESGWACRPWGSACGVPVECPGPVDVVGGAASTCSCGLHISKPAPHLQIPLETLCAPPMRTPTALTQVPCPPCIVLWAGMARPSLYSAHPSCWR